MSEKKQIVLGRYEILERLGKGGMAAVYKAYDPRFKREVALKVLRRQNATIIERFHREALAIAQLEHPAIVPIYDAGRYEDRVYIVMRYMPGGTLANKIRQSGQSGMSIEEIAALINRIGSALDVAHSKGIIHRDVKPANVLYDQYGQPFLADFGIAKLSDSTGTLTVDNIIGTPAYMSPEQVSSETVDGRSDIYSLGAILYEMLSGEMPYQADATMRLAMMHVMSPVPSITDVAPKQKKWQSVISKAMAKKPEKRYQTGREFSDAVMKTGRAQTTSFAAIQNQRQYIYATLGAVGLIAIMIVLGLFLLNSSREENQQVIYIQETEIAQITIKQQVQGTVQAEEAAALEAERNAFATESAIANAERSVSVQETVAAMVTLNETACTDQHDYDFDVGRITFKPRLGETHIEGEPFSQDLEAQWTVVNEGECPATNVRLVSTDGDREFIPTFINTTGDGQGNAIFEREAVVMTVKLDSIDDANRVDEALRFVVEDPDGRDLQLNNVNIVELKAPDDETWIVVVTPKPTLTPIPIVVVPTEKPDE